MGSLLCRMRLGRCKLLGIGTRKAKRAGLALCQAALDEARGGNERGDYGFEAEVALIEKVLKEQKDS